LLARRLAEGVRRLRSPVAEIDPLLALEAHGMRLVPIRHEAAGAHMAEGLYKFGGVVYATGSAKCDRGTQYRCEDGTWRQLDAKCPVCDAPVRVAPSGRSCMLEGATVANGSTICRSGSTSLCSDAVGRSRDAVSLVR
jgi:hypothetical protein